MSEPLPQQIVLLNDLVRQLREEGHFDEAIGPAREMLELVRRARGPAHADSLTALRTLAALCRRAGDMAEAEARYRELLEAQKTQLGTDHLDVADTLRELATLRESAGDVAGAVTFYKDAIALRGGRLGREHPDTTFLMNALGELYRTSGDREAARTMHAEALDLRRKAHGPSHVDVAHTLNNLGIAEDESGRHAEAEALYKEALAIKRQLLGEEHYSHSVTLNNLATLYLRTGRRDEAEPLLRAVIALWRRSPEASEVNLLRVLQSLAESYVRTDRHADAIPLYEELLDKKRRSLGESHDDVVMLMNNLGMMLYLTDRHAEAEPHLRRVVELLRSDAGGHQTLILSLKNLAAVYRKREDTASAAAVYRELLALQQETLDAADPEIARTRQRLAEVAGEDRSEDRDQAQAEPPKGGSRIADLNREVARLYEANEYGEAIETCERLLQLVREERGDDHADTATVRENLATLRDAWGDQLADVATAFYRSGKLARALPICERVCELKRQALGEDSAEFATSLNNLAELHRAMGNGPEAERGHRRALAIRKAALGDVHEDVAQSYNNLALTLGDARADEAESLHRQALEVKRQTIGDRDPGYATSLNNLAALYMRTDRDGDAAPLLRQAIDVWRAAEQSQAPHFVRAVESLAAIDDKLGDLPGAAAGFRELLQLVRARGATDLSPYLGRLAIVEMRNGHFDAAETLYREVLEIAQKRHGKRHPDVAVHMNNLAMVCYAQGKDEAEPLFLGAIKLWRKAPDARPELIKALTSLGAHYHARKNHKAAASAYRKALTLRRAELGDDHPDVATSLTSLARVLRESGDFRAARSCAESALRIRRAALDANDPGIAETLNLLALACEGRGDYARAEKHHREALTIRAASAGSDPSEHAKSLFNLAAVLKVQGRLADAETLFRQAGDIWSRVLGTSDPSYVLSQQHIAGLYHEQGRYGEAEALYLQTNASLQSALGDEHPSVALGLKALGALHREMGKFASARSLIQRAIDSLRKVPGRQAALADCLDSLAECHVDQGHHADALTLAREACDLRVATLGSQHPDMANSHFLLGVVHHKMGQYQDAEASYARALEAREGDASRAGAGEVLNALAVLYHETGRVAEAESSIRKAMRLTRSHLGETHASFAACLGNLADLHRGMGDVRSAERLYHQAFQIWRKTVGTKHPLFATGLSNLGKLFSETGNHDAARPLLDQALEIRRALLDAHHPLIANSLRMRAHLAMKAGDDAGAEPMLAEALTIYRASLGGEHPDVAECLHGLAVIHDRSGRYDSAESLHHQALDIQVRVFGREHPDVAASYFGLGVLCTRVGRAAEALALMREAETIEDGAIQQIFSIGSEKQRLQYLETRAGRLDGLLSLVFRSFADDAPGRQTAFDLVLRRKALVTESAAVYRRMAASDRHPGLGSRLSQWAGLSMQIARKTLAGPGSDRVDEHWRLIADWTRQKDELEAELVRQIPEMSLAETFRRTDRRAVAAVLREGQVLVDFVRYHVFDFDARGRDDWKPPRYCAFVLREDTADAPGLVDLGEAGPLELMIRSFRSSITRDEADDAHTYTDGRDLREAVFDPLLPHLAGCQSLVLAPDGDLGVLPFETLPLADGSRVIDHYAVSYVGTSRELLRRPGRSPAAAPVVVADPDFDLGIQGEADARPQFERLDGTRREGEEVAALLGVEALSGAGALESRIKAARSPRVLHVATHGFFVPAETPAPGALEELSGGYDLDSPVPPSTSDPLLRSGLALAGANAARQGFTPPEGAEDGILTAADVCGLDLRETDLVVLSACQTGLGDIHVGEGVLGLRRAFMLAGAKALVVSLWRVPDETTRTLMVAFYTRLLAGASVAAALREAQLEVKRARSDPYYWGAFVCHGDAAAGSPAPPLERPRQQ